HVGEIGNGVQGGLEHSPHPPCGEHESGEQDQETLVDGPADEACDHGCLSLMTCGSSGAFMRSTVVLRLASESIRNWPDTTTRWPASNPLRISVISPLSWPTSTSTGRNFPSPSTTMTTLRLPV